MSNQESNPAPKPEPHSDPGTPGGGDSESTARRSWTKLAGLGMELAGSTLGLAALGYIVDWYFQTTGGVGVALGALVGFSFGMFRFLQKAVNEIHQQSN